MHSRNQKRHSSPSVSSRGGPLGPVKPVKALGAGPGVPEALSFRVPKDFPHSRFSRAPLAVYPPKGVRTKPCVSLPVVSLEKIPGLHKTASPICLPSSSSSTSSSSSSSTSSPSRVKLSLAQRAGEKLSNGHSSSTSTSSSITSVPSGPPAPAARRPSPARSPLGRRPPPSAPSPSRSPSLSRRPPPSPRQPGTASPGATTTTTAIPSLSATDRKQQNGTKAPPRTHRCLSGRVFDPNKHCGVQDPETKRQCTRSLTCKTHSLTQRRAVLGRRRTFDLLLAEHKGRTKKEKEAQEEAKRERDGAQGKKEALTSSQTTTPSRPHCPNGRLLSTLKLRLANAHIPRAPGPGCAPAQPSAAAVVSLTANPPHAEPPECGVRLSSDDNEEDEGRGAAESPDTDGDRPSCPLYAARHPRPLGCCRFGSRLMGRGSYVFDRRWDRVRLALHAMVEKHLNAHMWRKVPPASETPLSPRTPPASPSPLDPHPHPYPPFHPTPAPAASALHPPPLLSSPLALASPRGKPRNGVLAPNGGGGGGPWGARGDQALAGARKRKMAAASTSTSPSSSSSSPTSSSPGADANLWKNANGVAPGSRPPPPPQPQPTAGWKRSLVRGARAAGGRKEEQTAREEGLKGYRGLLYRQGPGAPNGPSGTSFSLKNDPVPPHMTPAPPFSSFSSSPSSASTPLLLGQGGGAGEGRKRRSPGTPGGGGRGEAGGGGDGGGGRTGKASRGLESLFRRSNGTGGILSSGPPSP